MVKCGWSKRGFHIIVINWVVEQVKFVCQINVGPSASVAGNRELPDSGKDPDISRRSCLDAHSLRDNPVQILGVLYMTII